MSVNTRKQKKDVCTFFYMSYNFFKNYILEFFEFFIHLNELLNRRKDILNLSTYILISP